MADTIIVRPQQQSPIIVGGNTIGGIGSAELNLKQDKTDAALNTSSKTVVGAINEISTTLNRHLLEYNSLGELVLSLEARLNEKQDQRDTKLNTKAKTIVDAINELFTALKAAGLIPDDMRVEIPLDVINALFTETTEDDPVASFTGAVDEIQHDEINPLFTETEEDDIDASFVGDSEEIPKEDINDLFDDETTIGE